MIRSSTLVITAPLGMPALSAGPPAVDLDRAGTVDVVLRGHLDADQRVGRLAGLDQFVRDPPCLVDRDREAEADRPALLTARCSPPRVAIAVLMPISLPFMSTSAPPELPGLIAASVWIASMTVAWFEDSPLVDTGRSSDETMPVVTVPARPSGEPIAMTCWPTCRSVGAAEFDRGQVGLARSP